MKMDRSRVKSGHDNGIEAFVLPTRTRVPRVRKQAIVDKGVLRRDDISQFIANLYEGDLHAKRVLSLANATVGVLTSASLVVGNVSRDHSINDESTGSHA